MQIAIEKGRKTRPDIKLSICGEHGGEPREEDVTRLPNHQAAPGIQSGFLFAVTANPTWRTGGWKPLFSADVRAQILPLQGAVFQKGL